MDKLEYLETIIGAKVEMIKRGRVPHINRVESLYYYDVGGADSTLKVEKKIYFHFHSTLVTRTPIKELEEGKKKYVDVPIGCVDVFYRKRI